MDSFYHYYFFEKRARDCVIKINVSEIVKKISIRSNQNGTPCTLNSYLFLRCTSSIIFYCNSLNNISSILKSSRYYYTYTLHGLFQAALPYFHCAYFINFTLDQRHRIQSEFLHSSNIRMDVRCKSDVGNPFTEVRSPLNSNLDVFR